MPPYVVLLLGKPPRDGTLLAQVAGELTVRGCKVTVRLPHEETLRPSDVAGATLALHRGLRGSVTPLLEDLHERGVPLCNPWPADRLLRDRRAWSAVLERGQVPVPPSTVVEDWSEVLGHGSSADVVAKTLSGPGRGSRVLAGTARTLPSAAPFPGPYVVELRLEAEPVDRKLYVAGGAVRGLLKASTLEGPHSTAGEPFEPGPALVELARRVGRVLGAHVFGVDVLETPAGPVVVDVNGFPGFRGVAGASDLVAEHVLEHAAGSA